MPQLFVILLFVGSLCWMVYCLMNDEVNKTAGTVAGAAFGINFANLLNLILRAS